MKRSIAQQPEFEAELPVIEAIQQGDTCAMDEFVQRQAGWVRGLLFGMLGSTADVDDVLQRVWLRVWREAPKLQDPACWRSWVYRIARNAATDARRARLRRQTGLARWLGEQRPRSAPATDSLAVQDERHEAVLEAIAALPALYREPFVLKHMEDLSYRQIGDTLGLPVDTVETRLVRARRLLRERLADEL